MITEHGIPHNCQFCCNNDTRVDSRVHMSAETQFSSRYHRRLKTRRAELTGLVTTRETHTRQILPNAHFSLFWKRLSAMLTRRVFIALPESQQEKHSQERSSRCLTYFTFADATAQTCLDPAHVGNLGTLLSRQRVAPAAFHWYCLG